MICVNKYKDQYFALKVCNPNIQNLSKITLIYSFNPLFFFRFVHSIVHILYFFVNFLLILLHIFYIFFLVFVLDEQIPVILRRGDMPGFRAFDVGIGRSGFRTKKQEGGSVWSRPRVVVIGEGQSLS